MLIINGKIYLEDRVIEEGYILTEGSRIAAVGEMTSVPIYSETVLDAKGCCILPGFIDQHIHGANGADHMDGTREAVETIASFLPREGTTSYLATTMTQSLDTVGKAVNVIADYMEHHNEAGTAEILGIHLEGPFISPKHVGAQNPEYVLKPSRQHFDRLWEQSGQHIKLVTYAPEEAEAGFTDYLRSHGVIPSAGHTDSYYEDIAKEIPHGLSNLTHFHNAMLPHHHRKPGAVTAGFVFPELKAELITDGIHLNRDVVKATYLIKGSEGVIVITDAMRAKGLPDGTYDLGGQAVHKKGKECRLDNGTLAGSVAEMNFAVDNFKQFTQASMRDVVKVSSENAAKHLNVFGRKGSIAIGKDADLVIVDENIHVYATICRGTLAYQQSSLQI